MASRLIVDHILDEESFVTAKKNFAFSATL